MIAFKHIQQGIERQNIWQLWRLNRIIRLAVGCVIDTLTTFSWGFVHGILTSMFAIDHYIKTSTIGRGSWHLNLYIWQGVVAFKHPCLAWGYRYFKHIHLAGGHGIQVTSAFGICLAGGHGI